MDRDAAAITKDINKRFLPLAILAFNEQKERMENFENHDKLTKTTKEKTEELIQELVGNDDYNVSFENSGDKITLKFYNLSLDKAREMLKLYGKRD